MRMNRSENSVKKYMTELEAAGLLERKERAKGYPDMLYLKRVSYMVEA